MNVNDRLENHAQACREALREGEPYPVYAGPKLRGADLWGAYLEGAHLEGADLWCADLEGANLRGAVFVNANLVGACLRGAALVNASLCGANLRGANLRCAELEGADLKSAIMPDGRTFEEYKKDPLAGICDDLEARKRAIAAWGKHAWNDCPMHEAYGWEKVDDAPEEKRLLVAAFVTLFDAGLLPKPEDK